MVAAASQGLGFAIAKALAAEGAQVSIAARKQETICAAAARMQEQTGTQVMWSVADVGVRGGYRRLASRHGGALRRRGHAGDELGRSAGGTRVRLR